MVPKPEMPNLTGFRILVVEDEFYIADDLVRTLSDLGAEVVGPVPSRADAMKLLEQAPPVDIAILDINLHGQSVFPVADLLRQRGVPFIFASGYDADLLPQRFRGAPHCQKPFNIEALATALLRFSRQATGG